MTQDSLAGYTITVNRYPVTGPNTSVLWKFPPALVYVSRSTALAEVLRIRRAVTVYDPTSRYILMVNSVDVTLDTDPIRS